MPETGSTQKGGARDLRCVPRAPFLRARSSRCYSSPVSGLKNRPVMSVIMNSSNHAPDPP